MEKFEPLFSAAMEAVCAQNPDPSHDLLHVQRVVKSARRFALKEGANQAVVIPAAYLHDCLYISKSDPRRPQASRLSADRAVELLREWEYDQRLRPAIHHAIEAHSFSSGVIAQTLEAKIVQDADRLDAMGAIGIARCFSLAGTMGRPFYSLNDPFCRNRQPDDRHSTLDHFFTKLLKLSDSLHTDSAKEEAHSRLETMTMFLKSLESEIQITSPRA